jgi:peptidoglycan/LPS O-acetylase OafA/YrhL
LDTRHFSLSHTWSLAIEEQFYLVWPVFVAVLGKRGVRHASVMMLLIAVAVRSLGEPLNEWSYYFTAYTHWDGLAAGAFLATLTSLREPRREYARLAGCGSTVLLSAGVWLTYHLGVWFTRLGYTFLAAGFAAGIYCLLAQKETAALSRFFNGNTLRAFGKYSYAIYLLHLLVFSFVYRNAPGEGLGSTLWKYALCLFGSLLVGYLSFALFERRWLALKDRILAART